MNTKGRAATSVRGGPEQAAPHPAPAPLRPDEAELLDLQATAGNEAVTDLVAAAPGSSGPCSCGSPSGGCGCGGHGGDGDGRDADRRDADRPDLRRLVDQALRGPARPLERATRASMERRAEQPLGGIAVHRGPDAERAAEGAGARAFTVGSHIVLGRDADRDTLEHEVAHVAAGAASEGARDRAVSQPGDADERAAHRATHGQLGATSRPRAVLLRQVEDEDEPAQIAPVSHEAETEEEIARGDGETEQVRINIAGLTRGQFGGRFTTTDQETARGPRRGTVVVTGTMVETFAVTTTVTLPDVPSGLTECQAGNVRRAIDTTLAAHEQDHVEAMETYNGTEEVPFSVTIPDGDTAALNRALTPQFDSHREARRSAAMTLSNALDGPGGFNFDVDMDAGCETEREEDNEENVEAEGEPAE